MDGNGNQQLALDCWVSRLTVEEMELTYEVQNDSDSAVFLFNRLHVERTNEFIYILDRNRVFVSFEGDSAMISKRIPDVPPNVRVPAFDIPCATLLDAHGCFIETFQMKLPLRWSLRYSSEPGTPRAITIHRLCFSLGYYWAEDLQSKQISIGHTSEGDLPWVYVSPFDQRMIHAPAIQTRIQAEA